MNIGNPFEPDATLTVLETRPVLRLPNREVRAIQIVRDPRDWKSKPLPEKIDAVLASVERPSRVEFFEIAYDSHLRAVPDIKRFQNLEILGLCGGKITDYDAADGLEKLRKLMLVSYKEPTFRRFQNLELEFFRAIRGRIHTFDLSAAYALLQACAHLEQFAPVSITHLTLEACNRVDLASLANVRGLRRLELLGPKKLASLQFLEHCCELEVLAITATPLSHLDLGTLRAAPSLKRVFLATRDAVIEALGRRFPSLVVTNGDVCFARGERQPDTRSFYESESAGGS